jgi:hypothetical protein
METLAERDKNKAELRAGDYSFRKSNVSVEKRDLNISLRGGYWRK